MECNLTSLRVGLTANSTAKLLKEPPIIYKHSNSITNERAYTIKIETRSFSTIVHIGSETEKIQILLVKIHEWSFLFRRFKQTVLLFGQLRLYKINKGDRKY